jgi:DNA-3-methyladenine glycosylase I
MRCEWSTHNTLLQKYHDEEWGTPVHDDRLLFEHLSLDCFQAGLSWQTILNKRENFRLAFENFEIEKVATFDSVKVQSLMENPGIIRNTSKIEAIIHNARLVIQIQKEFGSFDKYIWSFTSGKTIQNNYEKQYEVPAYSKVSEEMFRALKGRGFKFIGSTICYAFMQAVGIVNDHVVACFRFKGITHSED